MTQDETNIRDNMEDKKYPVAKSRFETLNRQWTDKEWDIILKMGRANDYRTEQALSRLLDAKMSKRT